MTGRKQVGNKSLQGLLVGLAGLLLALMPWTLGWLDTWEARTWDWRASVLAQPGPATDDIRLILLDQNSLDWAYKENGLTWPWPRELYGAIINFCQRSGARAVAFDVLFTEPSKYGLADDLAFGLAAKKYGRFAGAVFLGHASGNTLRWPSDPSVPEFQVKGIQKWLASHQQAEITFPRASLPIPELFKNSAALCNIQLRPDPDGIYRQVELFGVFGKTPLASLGIGAFLAANPAYSAAIDNGRLIIDGRHIPLDKKGRTVLRYRGPSGTHKAYSAAAVLQSEIRFLNREAPTGLETEDFKDKYVFFGFSAPGLYDLRSAPVGGIYTGVEIHATMLDNFLSGDFIRHTPVWFVLALITLLAASCAVFVSVFSSPLATLATGSICVTAPVLFSLGAYHYGFWLPLVVQETAVLSSLIVALAANYATEGRQRRFIKNAFRQYLSPAVIEQLLQNPERLKLGGERKVLSIFFSDLQGFTSISEGLTPETLTNLLNDYLSAMTDIIHEEGGTVDKFEGDAIIAFWNAPLEVADHAARVVQAALRCQAKLAELRPSFKERIGKEMHMRIGINTGSAVVGNLGSSTRFDYTMLGDAVNLAARLEGINKQFGTYSMISESTKNMMGETFAWRELAQVAVVGRKKSVTVYEPMFPHEYTDRKDIYHVFAEGLKLFYTGDFEKARNIFTTIREPDPAAAAYTEKCRALIETRPEKWDGVWVMTTK